jgi:hypothetical protein
MDYNYPFDSNKYGLPPVNTKKQNALEREVSRTSRLDSRLPCAHNGGENIFITSGSFSVGGKNRYPEINTLSNRQKGKMKYEEVSGGSRGQSDLTSERVHPWEVNQQPYPALHTVNTPSLPQYSNSSSFGPQGQVYNTYPSQENKWSDSRMQDEYGNVIHPHDDATFVLDQFENMHSGGNQSTSRREPRRGSKKGKAPIVQDSPMIAPELVEADALQKRMMEISGLSFDVTVNYFGQQDLTPGLIRFLLNSPPTTPSCCIFVIL